MLTSSPGRRVPLPRAARASICRRWLLALLAIALGQYPASILASEPALRAPAVPLVPVDPYFSIWSPGDKLTDAATMHWTEAPNRLTSLIRIDGRPYRLMGPDPAQVPALEQVRLEILPTTVTYTFEGAGVRVRLAFLTPLLPEDLMIFSRPVTYLSWEVAATDGRTHDVQIHYDNSAELVVHDPHAERVTWASERIGDLVALRVGSVDQNVLRLKGDHVRINWGYDYVAVPSSQQARTFIAPPDAARSAWEADPPPAPAPPSLAQDAPVLAVNFRLGPVSRQPLTRWLILAYDDVYAAQFFHRNLKAYWRKDGAQIGDLLERSAAEYPALRQRCAKFDREFMADLNHVGGPKYAWVCALAYRQSFAASKVVVDANGQPLFFCKENTSNGCMGTVDVFYPQSPLPLLVSPSLAKAMLIPILEYASTPAWTWPNAPHDVGTWPQANGQVYGGVKSDGGMPVEESGNMLLLVAAVAQAEGNARFADRYWPVLTKWANYLQDYGRDPANQLCTDDFAGHLAHNANLAAKAICALGAYGKLAGMRGDRATADRYLGMARDFAVGWMKQADDGDHYRLAFDRPNTWSSKYNLVWDKILGLRIFPEAALRKEMAFYRGHLDRYGLPLDGRQQRAGGRGGRPQRLAYWSKTDWAFWTACLTGDRRDFDAITAPIYDFFSQATRRVGLTDLYFTDQPDAALMHSRPVIGGLFIKMLYDQGIWRKWASRDRTKANGPWASLPAPPRQTVLVPTSEENPATWRYTTSAPADNWFRPDFDDSTWQTGPAGFGAGDPPNTAIRTKWDTADIWLRREVSLPAKWNDLQLSIYHDEDAQVYLNGQPAARLSGYVTEYDLVPVGRRAVEAAKPGPNLVAVHVHQTTGGQFIDLGFVDVLATP